MTAMVLPVRHRPKLGTATETLLEVNVHLQATVMAQEIARHKANVWLSSHAGHLLLAEDPELLLGDPLQWRFRVVRSLPIRDKAGTVRRNEVGRMQINATTGEILHPEALIKELTANANAVVGSPT